MWDSMPPNASGARQPHHVGHTLPRRPLEHALQLDPGDPDKQGIEWLVDKSGDLKLCTLMVRDGRAGCSITTVRLELRWGSWSTSIAPMHRCSILGRQPSPRPRHGILCGARGPIKLNLQLSSQFRPNETTWCYFARFRGHTAPRNVIFFGPGFHVDWLGPACVCVAPPRPPRPAVSALKPAPSSPRPAAGRF